MSAVILTESLRLYPDRVQEGYFNKACSTSIHVYNQAKTWDQEYKDLTGKFANERYLLDRLKKYSEELKQGGKPHGLEYHTWSEGVFRYTKAREEFFKGIRGFPKYQSNKYKVKRSFHIREDTLTIGFNKTRIPGMFRLPTPRRNRVRFQRKGTRFTQYKPLKARIVHDGKYWYLRYSVKVNLTPEPCYSEPLGVDLGLKALAVTSDGRIINPIWNNQKYTKLLNRKKTLQRKLSRQRLQAKKEDRSLSNNYFKTRNKLRLVERHMDEFRKAFRVAVAKEIVKDNPSILVLEDLSVKEMLKEKRLSPKIHEVGWYGLRVQLEWEQTKKMAKTKVVSKTFPSSKTCSRCGYVKTTLSLSERVYSCNQCGLSIDRDLNAALNLKNQALTG